MMRVVEPEILDSLAEEDPVALHNRRDLRWINALMGNYRWWVQVLAKQWRGEEPMLEIGAGRGELAAVLRRRWTEYVPGQHAALDRASRPEGWSQEARWWQEDLMTFAAYAQYPVIVGNLIVHQFAEDELAQLGAVWREHARCLIFCEPRRSAVHQWQLQLCRLWGIHPVSLHDGAVSIRAGFRGNELAEVLGLGSDWSVRVEENFVGAYRMVACKR